MANEKRLIDANGAMEYAQKVFSDPVLLYAIKTVLDNAPTVDAVEVVHGHWELYPSSMYRRCSVCKVEYEKPKFNVRANYCPNCSADMRGENNEN